MNKGKTYLVTGVASGIGAETSRVLRAKGAKVIGVDRTETDNADQFCQVDLSDPASIDNLVASSRCCFTCSTSVVFILFA